MFSFSMMRNILCFCWIRTVDELLAIHLALHKYDFKCEKEQLLQTDISELSSLNEPHSAQQVESELLSGQ